MTNSELAPLELLGLDEKGKAPKLRVSSVDSARSIYKAIKDSDQGSSKNRALVDAMFNGAPPFNAQDLIEMGQGRGLTSISEKLPRSKSKPCPATTT